MFTFVHALERSSGQAQLRRRPRNVFRRNSRVALNRLSHNATDSSACRNHFSKRERCAFVKIRGDMIGKVCDI